MNPIGYNEIISDNVEKGIKTLITLLEQFNDVLKSGDNIYTETLNTLKLEIDSVNKSMKDLNTTAQKKNDYTEKEINELKQLAAQLEKLKADYDNLKNAQNAATQAQKQNSQATEETAGSIAQLKKELADLNKQKLNATEEQLKGIGAEAAKVQSEIKRLDDIFKQGANAAKNLAGSYDELSTRNRELKRELKQMPDVFGANAGAAAKLKAQIQENDKTLKDFDKTIGESFRNVGNYESAFDGLSGGLVGAFTAGGAAGLGFAAMEKGIEFVVEGVQKLAEEVQKANKELAETQNLTGLTGDSLNQFTASIQATAKVFEKDYNEVLLSANAISKAFGITQNEAIDLVNKGFAMGGDIQGDYLSKLSEYSTKIKGANIDAKNFLKVVLQGDKAGISGDKLLMAYEEGILSLKEYTKAQEDAIKGAFGDKFNAELKKGLASGEITVEQAFNKISKQAQKSSLSISQQQTIIADIFKSGGEEIGNLNDIFKALDDSQKINLDNLTATQKQQLEILENTTKTNVAFNEFAARFSNISGEFTIGLEKAKTAILIYVNDLFDSFSEIGLSIEKFFSLFGDGASGKVLDFFKELISLPFNVYANYVDIVAESFKRLVSTIFGVANAIKIFKIEFADNFQAIKDFASGKIDFTTLKNNLKSEGESIANAFNYAYEKTLKELTVTKPIVTADDKAAKAAADKLKADKLLADKILADKLKADKNKFKTNADYEKELAKLQIDLSKEIAKETKKQRPEFLTKTRSEIEKIKKLLAELKTNFEINDVATNITLDGQNVLNGIDKFSIQAEQLQQKKNLGIITENQLQYDLLEIEKQKLQYQILQLENTNGSILEIEKLKTQLTKLNATYYEPYSKLESLRTQRLQGIITEKEYEDALLQNKIDNINKELAEKEKLKDFDKEYYTLKNDLLQIDVDRNEKALQKTFDTTKSLIDRFANDSTLKFVLNGLVAAFKGISDFKSGKKSASDSFLDALNSIQGFATGVIDLQGKGSGTSDDNLHWLSRGESVITAKGTNQAKTALTAINKGLLTDNDIFSNINLGKFYEPLRNIESKPLQVLQAPQIDIDSLAVAIGRNITNFDVKETTKHLIISQQNANLVNRIIVKKQNKAT